VDDKATYGAGLAASMDRFAKSLGMTRVGQGHLDPTDSSTLSSTGDAVADQIVSANPDAVYCGCDSENALAFVKTLRQKGYKKPLMGGDALVNTTWTVKLGASAAQNFATSVGPDPARTASGFLTRYHKMFGSFIPQAYDATSYDAANIELNAIYHAAKAHQLKGGIKQMRRVVTKWVSQTRWYGATGLTTFDRNGDTTNRLISVYGVRGGSWKYLFVKKVTGINPTG
jgi:branched-chain amino acid transport system substrate-binding protein